MIALKLRLSLALATGIASWIAFDNWKTGLLIGLAVLVWRPVAGATRTIFVLDHETGKMTAQPQDHASDRYLKDR